MLLCKRTNKGGDASMSDSKIKTFVKNKYLVLGIPIAICCFIGSYIILAKTKGNYFESYAFVGLLLRSIQTWSVAYIGVTSGMIINMLYKPAYILSIEKRKVIISICALCLLFIQGAIFRVIPVPIVILLWLYKSCTVIAYCLGVFGTCIWKMY